MSEQEDKNKTGYKYCACGCGELIAAIDKKGRPRNCKYPHVSQETRNKLSLMRRGSAHHYYGKHLSEDHRKKLSLSRKGKNTGPAQHSWKGDDVGYFGLHLYMRKHLPIPELCEFCHQKKRLQLANMTGIYNRDAKNYKYLCSKCHILHDKIGVKAWITRRARN